MAGRGRIPKDVPSRARDARFTHISLDARASDVPPLPERDGGWRSRTLAWYAKWTEAPQATQFLPTDWQRLHMLAELVDRFFSAPTAGLLAEIRLNEERLGATAIDRQRLRWKLGGPEGDLDPPSQRRRSKDPRLGLVKGGKPA
jgi:hypothetical protein